MYKSIQKIQHKHDQRQKKFYKKTIKSIKQTIHKSIQDNQQKCFYQLPIFTFGEPINDLDNVLLMLKKYLKNENIKLTHINGLLVHLDWSKVELIEKTDLDHLYKKYS